ncbi:MAG: DUF72 domain-containing protein [Candidatus Diapherotrites archaeon]|nr:DUF72 domain-containing protein [Candidatus Diapherotrites archaeon]
MQQKLVTRKFFVGTSGYFYWHWVKKFYPIDLKPNNWLSYYAKHFSTVEINSTYYHFPKKNSMKSWKNKVPENFIFSIKGNKLITHIKKFSNCKKLVKNFYSQISVLDNKLACILWQLPPFLSFNSNKLNNILSNLDYDYKNVLEFRHKSWFCDDVFDKLRDFNVGFCCVSAVDMPDICIATSNFAYVRFHGSKKKYSSEYSLKELREWGKKIKKLKVKEVYCYFNNDDNAHAVKNALQLKSLLS